MMARAHPPAGGGLRIVVVWNAVHGHTDVLVRDSDGHMSLLSVIHPAEDGPGIIEGLRNLFPDVPVDVRPGAFRRTN